MASSSNASATSLLSLPTELIQHITCFLPCSSVLSLTSVNRRLRDSCDHPWVFSAIARGSLYRNGPAWPLGDMMLGKGMQDKRTAYAVERANGRAQEPLTFGIDDIPRDLREWLPQLLALQHPSCLQLAPQSMFNLHYQLTKPFPGEEDREAYANLSNLCFCMVALLLSQIETRESADIMTKIAADMGRAPYYDIVNRFEKRVPELNGIQHEVGAAAAMTILLADLAVFLEQDVHDSNHRRRLLMPSLGRIKQYSFMDIPPVYSGYVEAFSTCHLETMGTPEFLSGDWIGLYTDQRHRDGTTIHDMTGVHICARARSQEEQHLHPEVKVTIEQASTGQDSVGFFNLSGSVTQDGKVHLVKRYTSRPWVWAWRGSLTPFGVAGVWGEETLRFMNRGRVQGMHVGGHFWLWKKEWCNGA